MVEPTITEKPKMLVVGFEAPFIHVLSPDANNSEVIAPLWDRLFQNAGRVTTRIGAEMYGVIYSRPDTERSHPDEFQYIAGVSVDADSDVPDEMVAYEIGDCTFAVFLHQGPINMIGETCREFYRNWLPQSKYEHAGFADIELYDDRFKCDREDSSMEYWIPVKLTSSQGPQ